MLKILSTLLTLTAISSYAAEPIAMSYFDVGRLYDTIPSPFYDDKAYTPKGKRLWTAQRYNQRIKEVVGVIDSMNMPIVALFGVENETVARDIVTLSEGDYSYIHRTLDYYDGLDFALLYHGDKLFVEHIRNTYHSLYVACEIDDKKVDIHLTRLGRKFRTTLSPVEGRSADITIVGGALSANDIKRLSMSDILKASERRGEGDTRNKRGGWYLRSRVGMTGDFDHYRGGVYITPWLLAGERFDHLPIYIFIE